MAHVAGTRRVRMVGAEHWTEQPEQELATVEAGGDTYAVHERAAVDSARVRLALAPGEDAAAAARELHGEVVRDVRIFRVVGAADAEAAEALPEWRLTLPALDDPEHDPLPGLIARLAGAAAVAPAVDEAVVVDEAEAVDVAEDQSVVAVAVAADAAADAADAVVPVDAVDADVVVEPVVEAAESLPESAEVPLLEPLPEAPALAVVPALLAATPALEPVIPVQTFLPADEPVVPALVPVADEPAPLEDVETVADEPVAEDVVALDPVAEPAELAEVVEVADAADVVETPEVVEVVEVAAVAEVAEVVEVAPEASFDDVFEDPFAVPAEAVMPLEADDVAVAEPEVVAEVVETPVEAVAPVEADVVESAAPVEADEPEVVAEVLGVAAVAAVAEEPVAEVVEAVEVDADVDEVEAVEPEAVEPDALDGAWAAVAAVVAADRPACSTVDRDGACAAAADVVWQTPAGAAWACAWHWPSTMSGHVGAEVGAVHQVDGWTTWRDADSVTLAREAADLFAASARTHDKPVARALVALDTLDDMLRRLPDDVRGAILLWAVAVTNPEWDVDAVAQHGRVALERAQSQGRAVAFPDELYFQEQALRAPISPTGDEPPVEEAAPQIDGDQLFAQANAAAEAGDVRTAKRLWTDAAEGADHALSMRALGDLAQDSDDIKTAEEWYGRAAFQNEPTSMTRIGMIYLKKGQSERAAEWLRRAARFGDDEATTILAGLVPATA